MRNIKKDLLQHIEELPKIKLIKCIHIEISRYISEHDGGSSEPFILKNNWSSSDWDEFIESINFECVNFNDAINGIIWFEDGTYSKLINSDLPEFFAQIWEHYVVPEIPNELL